MRLQIKCVRPSGVQMHTKEIADPAATTVEQFKQDISGLVSLSPENIRLVCEGRVLENVYPLSHYNLPDNATIHCLEYRQQAAPSAAAQVIPTGNAQDEMMAQMMNNPMVEAMMSSPEMMQMMLQMNPQLQQLCEQNPEIRRILEDPETLQQSMRAMRNPQLMREMMRNADRGMAQLNTIPGGEDALRRLHTEMIDPLNDAMSGGQPGQAGAPGNQQGSDRYAQDEIPTAPLANPFDQSRNSPPTGAAGGSARASAATAVPGGGGGVMGMGPNPFASMGGMGGMGMPGANPFANLGAMGMPAAGSTAPPAGPPMGNPLLGGFGGVAPPPGGLFGGGSQQQSGAGNIDFLSQMLAGLQTSTQPASNMAATTSSSTAAAAASRDAGADEFKLELRYGSQAPIFHICKKTTSVKDLKGEVEPLVNFRRVYVRLIREGKVWENEKTVEDYLGGPAAGGATSSSAPAATEGSDHAAPPAATSATEGEPQPGAADAPKSFVVYVTKNVENGQREVPLLPTAAASPSASASPATPAVSPFLAAFGGGAPAPAAFGGAAAGPGGAGAALPLAGMGGGNDALMQMLLGGGGLGGGLGGGGANALGGGFGAMPSMLGGNPREVYSTQLGQLRAMGFEDEDQCVRILQEVNGDVSRALDRLFGA